MARTRPGVIKVVYAIDCLVRGGTELQLVGLIDRLDRSRFSPILLTIRPSDPSLAPVDCQHLAWSVPRLIAPGGVAAVTRLARWLRREEVDVVHTYFQDSTVIAGVAARLAGVPVRLGSFRDLGFWRTRAQELVLRRVYGGMTGFVCNAQAVKEHVAARDGISREILHVIPNGVDIQALPWVEHAGAVKNVGIVGNLTREVKRTDLLLEAAALLAPRYPELIWHVIGDGHLRPGLEDLAIRLGVADRVRFVGRVSDIPAYLGKLEVGVICSDSEGLSNAIIEYMLRGVVTVATAVGGNPELVRDGDTGLVIPPGDAPALARAIERLCGDQDLRTGMARRARRFVTQAFSWEQCLARHEALYRGEPASEVAT